MQSCLPYQFGIYVIPANYQLLQPKTIFVQNCPRYVDKDYWLPDICVMSYVRVIRGSQLLKLLISGFSG